jgi:hypothetical protein
MRIDALVYAGRIVAAEVSLHEAQNIVAAKMVLDLKAQARELRGGAEFGDASLWRVVVWEAAEICGDVALGVSRSKNILEIDKSPEFQNRVADSERTERHLFWFALFLKLLRGCLVLDIDACMFCRRLD